MHRVGRHRLACAAVLGANDGIVSTTSLMLGVAAAGSDRHAILVAGIAGLFAGALSMAAGEYVSVSSQADTEEADLDRERWELEHQDHSERIELANIYIERGLDPSLAKQVAEINRWCTTRSAHTLVTNWYFGNAAGKSLASGARVCRSIFCRGRVADDRRLHRPSQSSDRNRVRNLACVPGSFRSRSRPGGRSIANFGRMCVTFWGALAMAITYAVGILFGTVI